MYDQRTVEQRCAALATHLLPCLKGGILYAMKANPHVDLLRAVLAAGLGRADLGAGDAAEIRDLMTASGARGAVEAEIDAEVEHARAALDVVAEHAPGTAAVGVLREFTGWFAGREA